MGMFTKQPPEETSKQPPEETSKQPPEETSKKPPEETSKKPPEETFDHVLACLNGVHAPYPPGYILAYSNLGIHVLGEIVRRVSGMAFTSYIEQNIFRPLEMNTFSFVPLYIRKDYADKALQPYTIVEKQEVFNYYLRDIPAGSLNTTVLELVNFNLDPEKEIGFVTSFVLEEKNGILVIAESPMGILLLVPLSDTEAIIGGIGRGARESVYIKLVDNKEVVCYSGYEFEKTD